MPAITVAALHGVKKATVNSWRRSYGCAHGTVSWRRVANHLRAHSRASVSELHGILGHKLQTSTCSLLKQYVDTGALKRESVGRTFYYSLP